MKINVLFQSCLIASIAFFASLEGEEEHSYEQFLAKYPMHREVMELGGIVDYLIEEDFLRHPRLSCPQTYSDFKEWFFQINSSKEAVYSSWEALFHGSSKIYAVIVFSGILEEIERRLLEIFPDRTVSLKSENGSAFLYHCWEQFCDPSYILVPRTEIVIAPAFEEKTGDPDYAMTIARELGAQGVSTHIQKGRNLTSPQILSSLLRKEEKRAPILHLMLNGCHKGFDPEHLTEEQKKYPSYTLFTPTPQEKKNPNLIHGEGGWFLISTGSALQPSDLKKLKEAGIKIVVTSIEYAKWSLSSEPAVLRRLDEYFSLADHICFVSKEDLAIAQEKSSVIGLGEVPFTIVPISSTVEVDFSKLKPLKERPGHFLSFGIIRRYKGIEDYAISVAKHLKKMGSFRKVIICGSIMRGPSADPELLSTLLFEGYPEAYTEIQTIMEGNQNLDQKTSALLRLFHRTLQFEKPAINVEFLFDVEVEDLPSVFNQVRYALNFNSKGLSPHFSGITNAMLAHLKNYGLDLELTEPSLREQGKYADLAKVFKNSSTEEVAALILCDVEALEKDPEALHLFEEKTDAFIDEFSISAESVAKKYMHLYRSLP